MGKRSNWKKSQALYDDSGFVRAACHDWYGQRTFPCYAFTINPAAGYRAHLPVRDWLIIIVADSQKLAIPTYCHHPIGVAYGNSCCRPVATGACRLAFLPADRAGFDISGRGV